MEQLHLQWSDLGYMTPELTLVIAAVVLSLLDLVLPKRINRTMLGWLSLASILISIGFVISFLQPAEPKQLLGLSYRIDDFANIIKLILLTGGGLCYLYEYRPDQRTRNPAYRRVFLFAASGNIRWYDHGLLRGLDYTIRRS